MFKKLKEKVFENLENLKSEEFLFIYGDKPVLNLEPTYIPAIDKDELSAKINMQFKKIEFKYDKNKVEGIWHILFNDNVNLEDEITFREIAHIVSKQIFIFAYNTILRNLSTVTKVIDFKDDNFLIDINKAKATIYNKIMFGPGNLILMNPIDVSNIERCVEYTEVSIDKTSGYIVVHPDLERLEKMYDAGEITKEDYEESKVKPPSKLCKILCSPMIPEKTMIMTYVGSRDNQKYNCAGLNAVHSIKDIEFNYNKEKHTLEISIENAYKINDDYFYKFIIKE